MKTNILQTAFLAILLIILSGCTRNNGDIGKLFGQWKVTSITADGEDVYDCDGVLYFAFQSSVYCQKLVNEETHWDDCVYAKWKYDGNGIIIDFSDSDYTPFPATGMLKGPNPIEIVNQKDNDMVMSHVNTSGVKFVYTLKKW